MEPLKKIDEMLAKIQKNERTEGDPLPRKVSDKVKEILDDVRNLPPKERNRKLYDVYIREFENLLRNPKGEREQSIRKDYYSDWTNDDIRSLIDALEAETKKKADDDDFALAKYSSHDITIHVLVYGGMKAYSKVDEAIKEFKKSHILGNDVEIKKGKSESEATYYSFEFFDTNPTPIESNLDVIRQFFIDYAHIDFE